MKPNLVFATLGYIVIMLVTSPVAYSTENENSNSLPSYYPSGFQKTGVLTEIRSQYDWVVDGIGIDVSRNVLVHTLATNFSSLYYIKQGMELGYRKNSDGEIVELWELPDGTVDRE